MKRYFILLVSILIFNSLQAEEKKIGKTFPATGISVLRVESKDGNFKIENWEKQEIQINVTITALSNNPEVAAKIADHVKVKFKHKQETLWVKSDFSSFFAFRNFTNNLFRNGEFSINYDVKVPENIALDLILKAGNIIVSECASAIKIKHKNGSISVQELKNTAFFDIEDSGVLLEKAKDLVITSRNSNLIINKAKAVKVDSYNSKYEVNVLSSLEGDFSRDDLKIGDLQKKAIVNLNRGAFTLEHLQNLFEEVKVTAKNTKLAILLTPTPANVFISHHSSTKIDIGESMDFRMKFGETQKYFVTSGMVGKPQGSSKLLINTKGGELHLK